MFSNYFCAGQIVSLAKAYNTIIIEASAVFASTQDVGHGLSKRPVDITLYDI